MAESLQPSPWCVRAQSSAFPRCCCYCLRCWSEDPILAGQVLQLVAIKVPFFPKQLMSSEYMPRFSFTSPILLNYFSVWLERVIAPLWTRFLFFLPASPHPSLASPSASHLLPPCSWLFSGWNCQWLDPQKHCVCPQVS